MPQEIWKLVNLPQGLQVEVSNQGRLRSLDRWISFTDGKPDRFIKSNIYKHQLDRGGYPRVRLSVKDVKFSVRIHRLVAEAFITNPQNLPQVNHKDGNKENNNDWNLEYTNNSGNQRHAIDSGLNVHYKGRKAKRLCFTTFAITLDTNEIIAIMDGNEEMSFKGFDYRLVSAVIKGKRKSHKGCYFVRINHIGENE